MLFTRLLSAYVFSLLASVDYHCIVRMYVYVCILMLSGVTFAGVPYCMFVCIGIYSICADKALYTYVADCNAIVVLGMHELGDTFSCQGDPCLTCVLYLCICNSFEDICNANMC